MMSEAQEVLILSEGTFQWESEWRHVKEALKRRLGTGMVLQGMRLRGGNK